MARRRLPPAEPEPAIPERLRVFVVEDWIIAGEVPPYLPTTVNGSPPTAGYITEQLYLRARLRHMRARRSRRTTT